MLKQKYYEYISKIYFKSFLARCNITYYNKTKKYIQEIKWFENLIRYN